MTVKIRGIVVALSGVLFFGAAAQGQLFTEGEFDPGSWSAVTPFFSSAPDPLDHSTVSSDRFSGGEGNFMLQSFSMDVPENTFNVLYAPIVLTDFVWDPGVGGAIDAISATLRTFPAVADTVGHLGVVRLFIWQDGRLYSDGFPSLNEPYGYQVDDPEGLRQLVGSVATDFVELVPGVGLDLNSHPNFAGSVMQFGFGVSMTSTSLDGLGVVALPAAWDDATLRLSIVPEPAALTTLLLAAALMRPRRRCH